MKKALIILLVLPALSFAQVASPPTLIAGLSGLSVDKGNLDVALISEIVTEKQAELKKELIKRVFFDKLKSENYVTWEFAYNSLEILLNSQSKPNIQKELLEYASNATLVYSFTEAYLQVSKKFGNSALDGLIELWDKNSKLKDCFDYPPKDCSELKDLSLILPHLILSCDDCGSAKKTSTNLNNVLIDMTYDILRNDKTLKSLGFFKGQFPLGETYYQLNSQYWKNRDNVKVDALYTRMKKELSTLIEYYYVAKAAVNNGVNELERLITFDSANTANQLLVINGNLKDLETDLVGISKSISSSPTKESNLSERISETYLAFKDFQKRGNERYRVEDLYYADQVTLPLIIKLTSEYGLPKKYLDAALGLREIILSNLLKQAYSDFSKKLKEGNTNQDTSIKNVFSIYRLQNYKSFIELLDKFSKLDKAETYQFILGELKDLSKIFEKSDPTLYVMVSSLSDFLKKFTVFDKEKNAITMDVEEVISQLYTQYEAQTNRWLQVYFSVGLNQTFNSSNLTDAAGGNVGFAAEKLGFKIIPNAWNVKKIRAQQYEKFFGPKGKDQGFINKTPFISDFHFIAYGSGLLYNIVNVKTEEKFNRPLFGVGFGPSFFNSLDLHVFANWTFPTAQQTLAWDKPITGFSFDIKITEYLSRLKQKKSANNSASK